VDGETDVTIDQELETKILRYHFVEHWGVHTIAAQLAVHHSTVDRVLSRAGLPKAERALQPSMLDPYLPFVLETLSQYPRLTAARLYAMVQARGFAGGPSHFRARVAQLRPWPPAAAYLRLKTLPGDQSQVDWASFDYVHIGRAKRPLMAFVMVLSWSRQIFLRFYLNQRMESFLRGHVAAFEAFGGVPKVLLYDNLKSAVLERRGDAIRFNPVLLALAAHYHFEPRPVAVARGNEKGRVERAIRYIRDSFFAGRRWQDVDDLNAQADAWCLGQSANRACPEDPSLTVGEAFAQEQALLLTLPATPFDADERVVVSAGKTPYVRFDLNDYSIPHTHVRQSLTVLASLSRVRVLAGDSVIAEHDRCYGKAEQIEDSRHIEALRQHKHRAHTHSGLQQLAHVAPASVELLQLAVSERGHRPGTVIAQLLQLLEGYGASELQYAIGEALQQQIPHPNAVQQVLERRREQRHQPPPLAIPLDNSAAHNARVRPASLSTYDQLNSRPTASVDAEDAPSEDIPTATPEDNHE
jgi:transposase